MLPLVGGHRCGGRCATGERELAVSRGDRLGRTAVRLRPGDRVDRRLGWRRVSTLAAGLAFTAARRSSAACCRCRSAGRRPRPADRRRAGVGLALVPAGRARGQLGDLAGQLPQLEGVEVLAMDRVAPRTGNLARTNSVPCWRRRRTAIRSASSIFPEPSAGPDRGGDACRSAARRDPRGSSRTGVRRQLLETIGPAPGRQGLVVRQSRARLMGAETVADALGLPLLGTLVTSSRWPWPPSAVTRRRDRPGVRSRSCAGGC